MPSFIRLLKVITVTSLLLTFKDHFFPWDHLAPLRGKIRVIGHGSDVVEVGGHGHVGVNGQCVFDGRRSIRIG